MLVALQQIQVPSGQRVVLRDISWQDFETILEDLGSDRHSRIAYHQDSLEIMTPLPEHEVSKVLMTNFLEILLEELNLEFWSLGSTTFKDKFRRQGIEPDNCFYIANEAVVRGKDRLDLSIDPSPDLALEIDVTSRTHPEIYAALGVPELWQMEKGKLKIKLLHNGSYVEVVTSPNLPNFPLTEILPKYLDHAKSLGRNQTMRAFRAWVRAQI
ncbi:MAG: Uma2 family endonuclease [Coleofasciculaceae cyanobacterium SM2_1_6]|nr:Uma2 family endonuclease [Coleofasciculaceae cyanobacterium SM2_1_6]